MNSKTAQNSWPEEDYKEIKDNYIGSYPEEHSNKGKLGVVIERYFVASSSPLSRNKNVDNVDRPCGNNTCSSDAAGVFVDGAADTYDNIAIGGISSTSSKGKVISTDEEITRLNKSFNLNLGLRWPACGQQQLAHGRPSCAPSRKGPPRAAKLRQVRRRTKYKKRTYLQNYGSYRHLRRLLAQQLIIICQGYRKLGRTKCKVFNCECKLGAENEARKGEVPSSLIPEKRYESKLSTAEARVLDPGIIDSEATPLVSFCPFSGYWAAEIIEISKFGL